MTVLLDPLAMNVLQIVAAVGAGATKRVSSIARPTSLLIGPFLHGRHTLVAGTDLDAPS